MRETARRHFQPAGRFCSDVDSLPCSPSVMPTMNNPRGNSSSLWLAAVVCGEDDGCPLNDAGLLVLQGCANNPDVFLFNLGAVLNRAFFIAILLYLHQ